MRIFSNQTQKLLKFKFALAFDGLRFFVFQKKIACANFNGLLFLGMLVNRTSTPKLPIKESGC